MTDPCILPKDIGVLEELFLVFDRVEFNSDGEFVAKCDLDFGAFGDVRVSYYVAEKHLKALFLNGDGMNAWFDGIFVPHKTRDSLKAQLLQKLKEVVAAM